jgi:hypothetical protein
MTEILKIQDRVHTSPSTIFTKGDVLNLLKELEYLQKAEAEAAAEKAPAPVDIPGFYSPKQVRDLVLSISEAVEDRLINYDFSSEIEFELYGNQIEATVSTTDLVKEVMDRIVETANEELDLKMA